MRSSEPRLLSPELSLPPSSLPSIQGGAGGGLTGSGFRIAGQKNIIIRNMRISLSKAPVDLIGVTESTNIVSPSGGSSLK